MKTFLGSALVAALLAAPCPAAAGELKLSLNGGRVTLIAEEVPLRQILAEWGRIGRTTIVNGDKMMGPPLTLQIVDMPEREVLDLLLRAASGYIVAQRPVVMADASAYDRILIMPTSQAPAVSVRSAPPPFNSRPTPQPQPMQPDMDDPVEPINPPVAPGMQPQSPEAPAPTQTTPGMPANPQAPQTAPRPGMLPPPTPGQPNPYGAQPRPLPPGVRPPGGGGDSESI